MTKMFDPTKTIIIWRFEDAPEDFRNLSDNGGDEDWVAFVPKELAKDYIRFLNEGIFSNACQQIIISGVGAVIIGSHA